jgi:hypothetical protein
MRPVGTNLRALALFAGLALGCGVPTFILQQYDGPVQPAERVAIVRFNGKDTVELVSIDGSVADAHVPDDARLHVEVLPGKHVLSVANRMTPQAPPSRVAFVAEPSRTYQVVFLPPKTDEWVSRPSVFEIEPGSGQRLKDVTFAPPRATTKAPAPPSPVVPPPPPTPAPSASPEPVEAIGAAGSRGG